MSGNRLPAEEPDINLLCLVKGEHRYLFLFDDAHVRDLSRAIGRLACDPELSFTWYDAAMLSQKVRYLMEGSQ